MSRPSTRALDQGRIDGPEVWRVIDGVEFSHWDRWLLRLSLSEPEGLESIEATFRERRRGRAGAGHDPEAMLSQITDLGSRLCGLGRAASTVLDAEEIASEWLFKKAFKRVWHDGPHRKTRAMIETPRFRLERRALRGHWPDFPVSPATVEPELQRVVGPAPGYIDYRIVGAVANALEAHVGMLAVGASAKERLALYRAAMTTVIETMNRADDSGADLAVAFDAFETAYLHVAVAFLNEGFLLRDLIELAVWEDYGLIRHVDAFLGTLAEQHADLAVRHLALVIGELRREDLDYHLDRATRLRAATLASMSSVPADVNDENTTS